MQGIVQLNTHNVKKLDHMSIGGYGVALEKLQATFEFESSPLFSERESVALRVAARVEMVPNTVAGSTDSMTH